MSRVFVIVEHADGNLKRSSLEAVGQANEIAKSKQGDVHACFFEASDEVVEELGKYGVAKIYAFEGPKYSSYDPQIFSQSLCAIIEREKPACLIAPSSSFTGDLLARSSMRLKTGFGLDCVSVRMSGDELDVQRYAYAGKLITSMKVRGSCPMATLRSNFFELPKAQEGAEPDIEKVTGAEISDTHFSVKEIVESEEGFVDLAEADRIVTGGRPMGNKENFAVIKGLADAVHGVVGASRAAVDEGWISHDHQVGQTGKTVNPELYIACGVSGSIQHLAGMRTSKVIVAINTDAQAPIFSKCDYGIVGDLFQIVPELTKSFRKLLSE